MQKITTIFHCSKLQGTLAYATCLKRQAATYGNVPTYSSCNPPCPRGAKIRAMFPDFDVKAVKKKKNISLKPGSGRKRRIPKGAGVKNAAAVGRLERDLADECPSLPETVNLNDIELLLKAQTTLIMSLAREGRLTEAVNQLKLTAEAV